MRLRLLQIDRLASSPSGNPRWRLHYDGGHTYATVRDSMFGYEVSGWMVGRTFEVDVYCNEVESMYAV